MAVIASALPDVGNFSILLLMFAFMYAILGMYLFGAKFKFKVDPNCYANSTSGIDGCEYEEDRTHFNNLYWSFITVFQLLTIEDFPGVMINGMRVGGPAMAMYFISLIVLGNFVLANLVVAILLEGFEDRAREEEEAIRLAATGQNKNKALGTLKATFKDMVMEKRQFMFNKWKWATFSPDAKRMKASPGGIRLMEHPGVYSPLVELPTPAFSPPTVDSPRSPHSHWGGLPPSPVAPVATRSPIVSVTAAATITSVNLDEDLEALASEYKLPPPSRGHTDTANNPLVDVPAASKGPEEEEAEELVDQLDQEYTISHSTRPPPGREISSGGEGQGSLPGSGIGAGCGLMGSVGSTVLRVTPAIGIGSGNGNSGLFVDTAGEGEDTAREATPKVRFQEDQGKGEVQDKDEEGSDWGDYANELGIDIHADQHSGDETGEVWFLHTGKSLFYFEMDHPVREWCFKIVSNPWFDRVILVFIFSSSLTMAIERPAIQGGSTERLVLDGLNWVWTIVFFIEFTIKIIAWGFLFGPPPTYWRDSWCRLDGMLVMVSLIDILFSAANVKAGGILRILRIARLLRTLRPLRLVSRAPKLKLVVRTLMTAMESIGNTVAICGIVFLIFAILGIQLFAGKLRYCKGADGENIESVKLLSDCAAAGGSIVSHKFNYDHLGNAILTLFYVASFDGWVDQMHNGVDAVKVDHNMQQDHNPAMALFFVIFLLLGNFFILNMFIGVIVDSFQRALEPDVQLTEAEVAAKEAEEAKIEAEAKARAAAEEASTADTSYVKHDDYWQQLMWKIATNTRFEVAITVIITLNVLSMALEHYDQSQEFSLVLDILNYFFTVVFTVEMCIKISAFTFWRYIADGWNKFDFFIVLVSYLGITLDLLDSSSPINPSILRIMRVFRITRILKLLKGAQGVRALLDCVFKSLGQISNMCVLLLLYYFIYAAAGVELFGKMGCSRSACDGLSEHANFANFGMALLMLFRVCTGDNGNGVLRDTMRTAPDCDDSADCETDCCASAWLAPIYFTSFTVVAQFVLLNVVVAVLMAQLEESQAQSDDAFQKEMSIEEQAKAEGREVVRSESVQALIKLREGRMQKPRSEAKAEEAEQRKKAKEMEANGEEEEIVYLEDGYRATEGQDKEPRVGVELYRSENH